MKNFMRTDWERQQLANFLAQKKASGFWKRQGHGQLLHVRRELFVTPHAASAPTAFDHASNRSNISATGKYTKIDISTEVVSKFSKKFENTVATIQKKNFGHLHPRTEINKGRHTRARSRRGDRGSRDGNPPWSAAAAFWLPAPDGSADLHA
jgi:hypothetical protein